MMKQQQQPAPSLPVVLFQQEGNSGEQGGIRLLTAGKEGWVSLPDCQ